MGERRCRETKINCKSTPDREREREKEEGSARRVPEQVRQLDRLESELNEEKKLFAFIQNLSGG